MGSKGAGWNETPVQVLHDNNVLGCQLGFGKERERKREEFVTLLAPEGADPPAKNRRAP